LASYKLWGILGEIGKKILTHEDGLQRKLGLSEAEYRGLQSIEEGEKITCQEFSRRMGLSVSRGSRVVDRLCNKNFIERVDCQSDRRCKNIWLTKKGLLIRQTIKREIQKWGNALTVDYTEKKLGQLRSDLKKIADML